MNNFLDGNTSTLIMGIINITSDSFYASSRVAGVSEAAERAALMVKEGADMLDIGAESTRPGSRGVSAGHELDALIPVIEAIHNDFPNVPLSADTRRAAAAAEAIRAGASVINDVSGLLLDYEAPAMLKVLADSGAYYVLMHTRGTPDNMNDYAAYEDFWAELLGFFSDKIALLTSAGVAENRIIIDPGLGFAKRSEHNLNILANMPRLRALGRPLLIGASRKAFTGMAAANAPAEDRLESTLAVSALCAWQGADIIRVHDVAANKRVVRMIKAIKDVKPL